jgi:methyltransferase (TIGR00027 family)
MSQAKPDDAYSRTAELMAIQRGLESVRPSDRRLFSDPFAPALVSRPWRLVLRAAHFGPARRLAGFLYDAAAGPWPRASAVARTRLIDDLIADSVASAHQLAILGAGFDSRAWRLGALAEVTVFEVDQLATQAVKRRRLSKAHPDAANDVHFVPVDFERDDLADALRAAGFDPAAPGIFLWEGVTNYLTPGAVDATLSSIRRLAFPGGTLLFTYVDRAALDAGSAAFPEAARWRQQVDRRGEPWIFGLDPAALKGFLDARGFDLLTDQSTAEAGAGYFRPLGRHDRASGLYHVVRATTR